ncbi:hypothetical protein CXG81DRAFT_13772 [Caulochytrium protostelioides]|uniref:Glycosyl transferase n=1 Tax=Caulochytrium protostelioides TaxID=1555241 RepID=A0A4P9X4K6_9FUNG|nr:hypothetical protein CXG81DRAFT_13772 [Caulochytrium protostelioides]|eukprot:RKO99999.1 hypothetical protein CXG81DRAFT_13772 [Caulochytrium protostelioides]
MVRCYSVRSSRVAMVLVVAVFLTGLLLMRRGYEIKNTIAYMTRPLWDKPDGPITILPHYYAEGMDLARAPADACRLHGWEPNPPVVAPSRVFDATLISVELDLLEIRLHELWDVVDRFFLIETDHTFTGEPKPLTFADHRGRFAWAETKLVYQRFRGRALRPGEDPFVQEGEVRQAMTALLKANGVQNGDLVLMSDVDEIPSRHTIDLLRHCRFPSPLHLQLRNYLYSYEFLYDLESWRAQVHRYDATSTYYRHSMASHQMLADSGWHCSYCFRQLDDFIFKMKAFSHADRIGNRPNDLLNPAAIQDKICRGLDIFDLLPEAYDYKTLFQKMGDLPKQQTAVHLPLYLVQNKERFRFLLPGGCLRDNSTLSFIPGQKEPLLSSPDTIAASGDLVSSGGAIVIPQPKQAATDATSGTPLHL